MNFLRSGCVLGQFWDKKLWWNEPGQIQDWESIGLHLAQFTNSVAGRECSDCVCAEDTRGFWFVLLAEGGRAVSRIAERNCGGKVGREEGIRPCGTSSSSQVEETTKLEPLLDGSDSRMAALCCGKMYWNLWG